MKKLSVEEKARAYDEAIKRGLDYIRHTPATEMVTRQDVFEAIFPEFKESEEEKIRKNLIGYIKGISKNEVCEETKDSWIAWLEKQGELIRDTDTVDSNEDGLIAETIRYKNEKQGEQKSDDEVEPIEWSGKINSRNAKGVLKEMLDKKLKSDDRVKPKFKEGD